MSDDYYIGLSREQIEKLLNGEEVGKRPYDKTDNINVVYNGTVRIHVRMLSEMEESIEPKSAFDW